jgi:AraC family transcriptional regulator
MTPEVRWQEADIRAQSLGLGKIRLDATPEMVIAGHNKGYTRDTAQGIPQQWDRFAPLIGKVPGQIGSTSYGVTWNTKPDCTFDSLTGVEISDPTQLGDEWNSLRLASRRYAVFTHKGHVSRLPATFDTIWSKWVPDCGLPIAKAPCFERYTSKFDPKTGTGEVEIWIPLES